MPTWSNLVQLFIVQRILPTCLFTTHYIEELTFVLQQSVSKQIFVQTTCIWCLNKKHTPVVFFFPPFFLLSQSVFRLSYRILSMRCIWKNQSVMSVWPSIVHYSNAHLLYNITIYSNAFSDWVIVLELTVCLQFYCLLSVADFYLVFRVPWENRPTLQEKNNSNMPTILWAMKDACCWKYLAWN